MVIIELKELKNLSKKISKYCSKNCVMTWDAMENILSSKENIKIANTGLVSSGKSSIFNMLLDSIDEERFLTGAARKTIQSDEEILQDNIYLVDTPGINVRQEDDEKAFISVMSSDIIVFVHNVKLGVIQKQEYEWIERICKSMSSKEEIQKRLVIAISWIDERDDEQDYNEILDDIKKNILDITQTEVDFVLISAKRYLTGMKKSIDKLIEKSNIKLLKEILIEKSNSYISYKDEILQKEINNAVNKVELELLQKKNSLNIEINEITENIKEIFSSKLRLWMSKIGTLKSKKETYNNLKREYENI